ncbi:MAG: ATPase [Chromatiaceae bacterium]|nr:MAG: ATPase [Chromatiaceae bacterium]
MSTAEQAYLNTRVSAMSTRLLAPGQVEPLLDLSLGELAARFGLAPPPEERRPLRTRSRAVEQALVSVLLEDLRILIRPIRGAERRLLLAWGRKFALLNLKTLIRGKLASLDAAEIRSNLFELPSHAHLAEEALDRAEGVLELLRLLERGPHASIARQARELYERRREPFALEAAIDQRYYSVLLREAMRLRDANQADLRRLIGSLLDQVALLWLLRFRCSFGLSPSEAFYFLVPSPHLLHRDRLLALAELEGLESVLAALPEPLGPLLAGSENLLQVQQRLNQYSLDVARSSLALSQSAVARALAYLLLRENDLFLLFSLMQGQLLGLPRDLIAVAVEQPLAVGAAAIAR